MSWEVRRRRRGRRRRSVASVDDRFTESRESKMAVCRRQMTAVSIAEQHASGTMRRVQQNSAAAAACRGSDVPRCER